VTVIHDELVVQIPEDKVEHFRGVISEATKTLNDGLNWSVKLRFGFVTGKTLYEAK
jgi:DNA polymerase I-like protein with 3'-5' exonuclease and polymerase domains